jgi:hypothetical protein
MSCCCCCSLEACGHCIKPVVSVSLFDATCASEVTPLLGMPRAVLMHGGLAPASLPEVAKPAWCTIRRWFTALFWINKIESTRTHQISSCFLLMLCSLHSSSFSSESGYGWSKCAEHHARSPSLLLLLTLVLRLLVSPCRLTLDLTFTGK